MAKETKWKRIARQRAAFDAHRASGGTMSEGEFACYFGEQERAKAEADRLAMPSASVAVPAVASPAPTSRRVDRVWAGGDRDSDDIYTKR